MSFTGSTPLQQFARLGLSLTIGDFRQLSQELNSLLPHTTELDDTEVVEALFAWMTEKVEEAAPVSIARPSPVLAMLEEK